ncbi:MAG: hypothetical protein LUC94_01010 [Clostridiales bacterium]|nr:hypothetical protein [Clostridiales bacterium]
MEKSPTITVQIYSGFYNQMINLQAYTRENGELVILHTGLKDFVLNIMKEYMIAGKEPLRYAYHTVCAGERMNVVDCAFSIGTYVVVETGESGQGTLYTEVARNYSYLEAQKRAFDRAAISFFQLQLDGRRIFADSELWC